MPIITLSNQKGGCGKTTESVNLAAGLALMEYTYNPQNPARVLLVDGDPQAQSSNIISGGIFSAPSADDDGQPQLADLLTQDDPPPTVDAVRRARVPVLRDDAKPNLFYVHTTRAKNAAAEELLAPLAAREFRLRDALEQVRGMFRWIVIDTPPGLGWLLTNALVAADFVIIPVETSALGLDGLRQTEVTLARVKKRLNRDLELLGVLPTLVGNNSLSSQIVETITADYGDVVLPPIRFRTDVSVASAEGLDIFSYRPGRGGGLSSNPAVVEHVEFINEVVRRCEAHEQARAGGRGGGA